MFNVLKEKKSLNKRIWFSIKKIESFNLVFSFFKLIKTDVLILIYYRSFNIDLLFVDLCLDLSQIDTPSAHEMNAVGQRFGLTGNDFFSFLTNDVEEQEAMRLARQQEEEKAMFSVSFKKIFFHFFCKDYYC